MRGADRMTRVIRFRNNDVLSNRDGVLTVILEALQQE
jgi:very-short-patch-repair endonuclease